MAREKITRLFLVERLRWAQYSSRAVKEAPAYLNGKGVMRSPFRKSEFVLTTYIRLAGAIPVKAFLDQSRAEARCRELEAEAWANINPFDHGVKLADWTRLDAGRLRDWLLDAGLEPPGGKFNAKKWQEWYDRAHDSLTQEQRLKVREALDGVRFYRVSELQ